MYRSVKGTRDLLPADTAAWQHVEEVVRSVMRLYRFEEIRTPMFEDTAVFTRGIGEETDIVGKEMYTFVDKGGSSLTLRPEMTAPVIRAYNQHGLGNLAGWNRLYYIGPMFRQERPQAGRFRQFHQFGFESIGLSSPECDAEIIAMAAEIYRRLGIGYTLKLNSVGDASCRPAYREALQDFLHGVAGELSAESQRRMETNPMRVLDSKDEGDRAATAAAPVILDYLSDECAEHFAAVRARLDALGIAYTIDTRLVRGLDYYTKTAFEFVSADLGSQDALGGGGRYDALVEQLGGKDTPAVGFASGIERILMVMEKNGYAFPEDAADVYIIALDEASRRWAFATAAALRGAGVGTDIDYAARSFKAQMREANKSRARFALIVGESELAASSAVLKSMADGAQEQLPFDGLVDALLSRLQDNAGS